MRIITLLLFFVLFAGCNRARFNEFRGEKLDAGNGTLSRGRAIADKQCSTCHLTPSPESMTQPTANYMLAYMGLFLGIDASRTLDDAERMHFKMRFEMLKRSGAIPARAAMVSDEWQALRSYYLALARYPFESGEKPESLPVKPVPLGDQGVTLLKRLADGRIAVGGGVSGDLFFFNSDLTGWIRHRQRPADRDRAAAGWRRRPDPRHWKMADFSGRPQQCVQRPPCSVR